MNRWLSRVYPTLIIMCLSLLAASCAGISLKTPDAPTGDTGQPSRTASTWHKRIPINIDEDGVDAGACMVNGNPAICYLEDSTGDLKYLRATDADGTTWTGTPVTADGAGTSNGGYAVMAVIDGSPAIAYMRDGDLYYVRANDANGASGQWGTPELVDSLSTTGVYPRLITVTGNPAIAYWGEAINSVGLRYVRADDAQGDAWGSPVTIDIASGPYYSNLIMANGRPAIVYGSASANGMAFLRAEDAYGDDWDPANGVLIDAEGSAPEVIQGSGGPFVGYQKTYIDPVSQVLVRKTWACRALNSSGSSWDTPFQIDTEECSSGVGYRLAVVNGYPYLSYFRDSDELMLARATHTTGATFASPEVIETDGYSFDPNFFVCNSKPVIITFPQSADPVYIYSATDGHGRVNGFAQSLFSGGAPCAETVDNYPAIAYMEGGNLNYYRALDDKGYTWGTGVGMSLSGAGQPAVSMVEVDDKPAICYFTSGVLHFRRATDDSGSTWGSAVTVESGSNNPGFSCSLANIWNGTEYRPAVAYLDTSSGKLLYEMANDDEGTAWTGTVYSLDNDANPSYGVSLVETKGSTKYPAVAYTGNVGGSMMGGGDPYLRYVRGSAVGGTSWNSPITLDMVPVPAPSLAFTGSSKPAVGYYVSGTGLKYCRASDTEGDSWNSAQTLTASCTGTSTTSMKTISARPAIAYQGSAGELRYAHPGGLDLEGQYTWSTEAIDLFGDNVGIKASLTGLPAHPFGTIFVAYTYIDPTPDEVIRVISLDPSI